MLIAVDIGNSSTKVGWFDEDQQTAPLPQPSRVADFPTGNVPPRALLTHMPAQPVRWRIVSVHRLGEKQRIEWISSERPQDDCRVLVHTDLPLTVCVDFPERVGMDRLAAAVSANVIRKRGRPAIVVDAGSAITVDLVDATGAFQGGVIMPGFRMSAEALSSKADLLPLTAFSPEREPSVVGKNTEDAIRSGLFWGAVGGVREIIDRMSVGLSPQPQVFVTGGDLRRLAERLGGEARFVPHMVLAGIAIATASDS